MCSIAHMYMNSSNISPISTKHMFNTSPIISNTNNMITRPKEKLDSTQVTTKQIVQQKMYYSTGPTRAHTAQVRHHR